MVDAILYCRFAPSDLKFATGGDDSTSRIWDFKTVTEERILRACGSDVRAVDWHPSKGLLVTGRRDSQQPVKHFHGNGMTTVHFNAHVNWLLTGSREHLIKLIDIRPIDKIFTFKGHTKDSTSVPLHPIQEKVFVSGGADWSLICWDTLSGLELTLIEGAHEQAIWVLDWHPLGHILASGSNENNTVVGSSKLEGLHLIGVGSADSCGQMQVVMKDAERPVLLRQINSSKGGHWGAYVRNAFIHYDLENCDVAACREMMSKLEQTVTNASFAGLRIFFTDNSRLIFRLFHINPTEVLSKPLIGIAFALSEIKKFVGRIESTVVNRDGHYDFRLQKSNFVLFFLNIRHRFAH
ncbi:WD40 domain containing protein [Trichuris trichiura]|uniref:WD40 domain containing protein n=1 Tax=Trichuris trichiura TaxID=36087 RepID=A0A077ZNX7_TRITR|nr:WD40 domain containing protein [Trichuris trichiura]